MKKVLYVIGILACLSAAEGLNRFGGLVMTFGGGDTPFYVGMLVVSLVCVVLFILAFIKKLPKILKWSGVVCLFASTALMMNAPAFPVNMQIIASLAVAFLCLIFATPASAKKAASSSNG